MTAQRQTKQLQAVRHAFKSAGRPLSIDELHELASSDLDSLGLRTVYRVVRKLQQAEEIVIVSVPGSSDRYELASAAAKHHHHFHCVVCDRMFDVDGCPGQMAAMVPSGFVLEHHEITLSGRCDACA